MSNCIKVGGQSEGGKQRRDAIVHLRRTGTNFSALNWPTERPRTKNAIRMRAWYDKHRRKATTAEVLERRAKWAYGKLCHTDRVEINRRVGGRYFAVHNAPEFVSAPDAVDMSPEDISNVEWLSTSDELAALKTAAAECQRVELTATGLNADIVASDPMWDDWLDGDGRWESEEV
jgi:hypothetical protein